MGSIVLWPNLMVICFEVLIRGANNKKDASTNFFSLHFQLLESAIISFFFDKMESAIITGVPKKMFSLEIIHFLLKVKKDNAS